MPRTQHRYHSVWNLFFLFLLAPRRTSTHLWSVCVQRMRKPGPQWSSRDAGHLHRFPACLDGGQAGRAGLLYHLHM